MHLRAARHRPRRHLLLWGLFLGLVIWLGGELIGYASGVTFIVGVVAGFVMFLLVRIYGEDEPRRP